jgi:hypothetical protein
MVSLLGELLGPLEVVLFGELVGPVEQCLPDDGTDLGIVELGSGLEDLC